MRKHHPDPMMTSGLKQLLIHALANLSQLKRIIQIRVLNQYTYT